MLSARTAVVQAVCESLTRSALFPWLRRAVLRIGLKFGAEGLLVHFPRGERGVIRAEFLADWQSARPPIWLTVAEADLLALAATGRPIPSLDIEQPRGEPQVPALARLLYRCLSAPAEVTPEDRDTLVYPSLFGWRPPVPYWRSDGGRVQVLRFAGGWDGEDVFVSAGFTDPGFGPPAVRVGDQEVAGYGYELLLLSPAADDVLGRCLAGWVQDVLTAGRHVLPGQVLTCDAPVIPGTDLGGFEVTRPTAFPQDFTVLGGRAFFHLLRGIRPAEVEAARQPGSMRRSD